MTGKIPRVFSVGPNPENDFTADEIDLLVYKVRDWFASDECDRNYSNPLKEAKDKIEQCLQATTATGKIWLKAPDRFEDRVKVKTLFDMEEGNHISQERAKTVLAKQNEAHRQALAQARQTGQGPGTATVESLQKYQQNLQKEILDAYPELDTPVHKPNVTRLAMLYTEQERIRMDLPGSSGKARRDHIETLSLLERTIKDAMKALSIYPDQLMRRMNQQRSGSVGDLVEQIGEDADFKDREKRWALTLALQLWWMTKHPNGKKTGPQIHDFEMWHLTRTRPIRYKCKCGHESIIVEGFTPEELRDYLVDHGVLIEKPIIPQLLTEEDLNGLEKYTDAESTFEDQSDSREVDSGGIISDSANEGGEGEGFSSQE